MTHSSPVWQKLCLASISMFLVAALPAATALSASPSDEVQEAGAEEPASEKKVDPNDPFANAEWEIEEGTGRRYIVHEVPKIENAYRWVDETKTMVRLPGGLKVPVVDHDEKTFWVKIYEPPEPRFGSRKRQAPSAEDLEAVGKTYTPEAEKVDSMKFRPWDEGLPKSGQWRNRFDLADMNADGHLDIVFGPARKGRPRPNIFLGNGEGQWRHWGEARYPNLPYDYGAAVVGDWNGDGHPDLALGVHLRGILALVSDGKGKFEPWTEGIQFDEPGAGGDGSSFSSRALMAIDWDLDGKQDILAFGEGPKGSRRTLNKKSQRGFSSSRGLVVYLNQGDGSWRVGRVEQVATDFGDDFDLGDVDGDGKDELLVASRVQNNQNLLRKRRDDGMVDSLKVDGLRPMIFATATASGDLDGNGRDDILIAYRNRELDTWRAGLDVFYSTEEGWKRRPLWFSDDITNNVSAMALGEVNGKPGLDLVATTGRGQLVIFLGDGEGYFAEEQGPELPSAIAGCHGFDVHLSDFDGDGRDEIVAAYAGEPAAAIGLQASDFQGCPGRGRIEVWKGEPLAPAAPAAGR